MHVHGGRREKTDDVLDDDERDTDREKDEEAAAAGRQHADVSSKAHGREEHEQQGILEGHVERHRHAEDAGEDGEQDGHEAATDNRRRNAESLQQRHVCHQRAADEVHGHRHQQGENQVQLDLAHATASLLLVETSDQTYFVRSYFSAT